MDLLCHGSVFEACLEPRLSLYLSLVLSCLVLGYSQQIMMKPFSMSATHKTRQDKTRLDETRRDETRQDKTRRDKTRCLSFFCRKSCFSFSYHSLSSLSLIRTNSLESPFPLLSLPFVSAIGHDINMSRARGSTFPPPSTP